MFCVAEFIWQESWSSPIEFASGANLTCAFEIDRPQSVPCAEYQVCRFAIAPHPSVAVKLCDNPGDLQTQSQYPDDWQPSFASPKKRLQTLALDVFDYEIEVCFRLKRRIDLGNRDAPTSQCSQDPFFIPDSPVTIVSVKAHLAVFAALLQNTKTLSWPAEIRGQINAALASLT
jgi:hypothetical protein